MKRNIDQYAIALNSYKKNDIIPYKTMNEFRNILKQCGFPNNLTFWTVFVNSIIITRVAPNKYAWSSADPIYKGIISDIFFKYTEKSRQYNSKYKQKSVDNQIENAIQLLKNNGFVVFKQL